MTNGFQAFARAVGWGTLAGAAPFMVLIFIPLALTLMTGEDGGIGELATILVWPLMLSGAMVLGSAVLLGLPLTVVLANSEREDGGTYAMVGLGLGAVVPTVIVWGLAGELGGEALFFALPGALAGLVTGTSWGRWREARRAASQADPDTF